MKVIVAGSRGCDDYTLLLAVMDKVQRCFGWHATEIVSGGAKGVDRMAKRWAWEHDIPIREFPYRSELGPAGGPARNRDMAKYGHALVAIWDAYSPGTLSMIRIAREEHVPRIHVEVTRLLIGAPA